MADPKKKPAVSDSAEPPAIRTEKKEPAEEAVPIPFDGEGLVNVAEFDLSRTDHFSRMCSAVRERHTWHTQRGEFKQARAEAKKMLGILQKAL